LAGFAIVMNLFSVKKPAYCMSSKKEIEQPLDTEQAKNLELDETPKPNDAEPSTHDKIKGRRVIK
jgi:predicted glycosyltransferase